MADTIPIGVGAEARDRRVLKAEVAAERSDFIRLARRDPRGFVDLLSVLVGDEPLEVLSGLDPRVASIALRLAAMACADIVVEVGGDPGR